MNDTNYCVSPEHPNCPECKFGYIEEVGDCWGFPTSFFEVTCFCKKSDVEKLRPELLKDVENE